MSDMAEGVLLTPFEEEFEQPALMETSEAAVEAEPVVAAEPEKTEPAKVEDPETLKLRKELDEAKGLAEFWAKRAAPEPKPEPKADPTPARVSLTNEQIADRIVEGDHSVLAELGYVRREDVERIAQEAADKRVKVAESNYEQGAALQKQYGDYLTVGTPQYEAVAKEVQTNPTWQNIAKINPSAALEGALSVVKARMEATAPPAKVDYDKRIENQASAKTKPAANGNGVSTLATASQKATADAMGIPLKEFMDSVRELRGVQ